LKNLISLGIVFLFIKAIKYSKIEKLKNMHLKKRKTSIDEISVLLILQNLWKDFDANYNVLIINIIYFFKSKKFRFFQDSYKILNN
jgi:hypothetical protein